MKKHWDKKAPRFCPTMGIAGGYNYNMFRAVFMEEKRSVVRLQNFHPHNAGYRNSGAMKHNKRSMTFSNVFHI